MLTPIFADGSEARPVPFTQFIQQPRVSTISVDKTLCLPDGGTALIFAGKRVSEYPDQAGPSILSKIPYLNGLFKDPRGKREKECVLFMVTQRIVSDEKERRGVAAPPRVEPPAQ
jgi:type II secretory pathway component GspD/PulD (secretin)